MTTGDGSNDAMSIPVSIMTICDGMALLIIVQNDDDARRYGYLVMLMRYVINDDLQRHFSLIFSNLLMTPPLGIRYPIVLCSM